VCTTHKKSYLATATIPLLSLKQHSKKNKKSLWDPPRSKRGYLCVVGLREGDALTTRTLLLSL